MGALRGFMGVDEGWEPTGEVPTGEEARRWVHRLRGSEERGHRGIHGSGSLWEDTTEWGRDEDDGPRIREDTGGSLHPHRDLTFPHRGGRGEGGGWVPACVRTAGGEVCTPIPAFFKGEGTDVQGGEG